MTLAAIGAEFGVSQQRVQQITLRAERRDAEAERLAGLFGPSRLRADIDALFARVTELEVKSESSK